MRRIYSGAWVKRDRDTHEIPGLSSASNITSFGCPKYRRQVLVPPVDTRLKKIIGTVAAEYGFTADAVYERRQSRCFAGDFVRRRSSSGFPRDFGRWPLVGADAYLNTMSSSGGPIERRGRGSTWCVV